MKKLVLAALLLVACGDKDDEEDTSGEGAACETEGARSCSGDVLYVCQDGALYEQSDCYANDEECVDDGDGEAYCQGSGGSDGAM